MRQLTINGTSWLEFREVLAEREPFKTYGNLSGHKRHFYSSGRLPKPYDDEYYGRAAFIDYTVLSYGTPIAWHDTERGWVMPDVKYSSTTSKAQGRIAPAIAQLQELETTNA